MFQETRYASFIWNNVVFKKNGFANILNKVSCNLCMLCGVHVYMYDFQKFLVYSFLMPPPLPALPIPIETCPEIPILQ